MRRSKPSGRYTVTGPDSGDRAAESVGVGISFAQTLATRHRRSQGVLTWYVRDLLQGVTYAIVTKQEDGVITTEPRF